MHADVAAVLGATDPLERARRAGAVLEQFQQGAAELARIRREALMHLVEAGMSHAEIGEKLDLTRQRVGQLLKSGPAPERAFLGTGTITVVFAGKVEASRPDPQPVIAQDDMAAYDNFRKLSQSYGLNAVYDVVPTGGFIPLNRENLVVMCGPRHSPNLREVIESDEAISFSRDNKGWYLVDNVTQTVLRSPMDSNEPKDLAYMARLPRPDGKGTFLYGAGIHAVGEAGVVHYLQRNLGEMYKALKQKRFSAIIECEFDNSSPVRSITATRLLTEYYHPTGK